MQSDDDSRLVELLRGLTSHSRSVQRRSVDALCVLAHGEPSVSQRLLQIVEGTCSAESFPAAYALARLGDLSDPVVDVLFAALGSDDPDRRWSALDLLSMEGVRSRLEVRALRALGDGSMQQRKMTVHLLRCTRLRSEAIETLLLDCLEAGDVLLSVATVRCLAACALRPAVAAERLTALVGCCSSPQVARAAASALGDLGYSSAAVRAALTAATKTQDESLRRAATRALEMLGPSADPD